LFASEYLDMTWCAVGAPFSGVDTITQLSRKSIFSGTIDEPRCFSATNVCLAYTASFPHDKQPAILLKLPSKSNPPAHGWSCRTGIADGPGRLNPLHCLVFFADKDDICSLPCGSTVILGQVGIRYSTVRFSLKEGSNVLWYPPLSKWDHHSIVQHEFDHFGICREMLGERDDFCPGKAVVVGVRRRCIEECG
jgi:hypothetical protein